MLKNVFHKEAVRATVLKNVVEYIKTQVNSCKKNRRYLNYYMVPPFIFGKPKYDIREIFDLMKKDYMFDDDILTIEGEQIKICWIVPKKREYPELERIIKDYIYTSIDLSVKNGVRYTVTQIPAVLTGVPCYDYEHTMKKLITYLKTETFIVERTGTYLKISWDF